MSATEDLAQRPRSSSQPLLLQRLHVGDERFRSLLPDEFHRVTEPELVNDHRPFQLRHPQRIRTRRRIVRQTLSVADLAHQAP